MVIAASIAMCRSALPVVRLADRRERELAEMKRGPQRRDSRARRAGSTVSGIQRPDRNDIGR